MPNNSLYLSSSPHVHSNVTVPRLMKDVVIALIPATIVGAVLFGLYSLLVVGLCVLTCVATEFVIQKLRRVPVTINDFSAIITGLLLGLNLPPEIPLWLPVIGGIFAIAIAKQAFGGLAHNFLNPALAARCVMLISWPVYMTTWSQPLVDAVSSATPLALLKAGDMASVPPLMDMFTGNIAGCIGEVSAIALLLGGLYLVIRKVIHPVIPLVYISTVFVLTTLLSPVGFSPLYGLYEILGGGLFIGAIFMATDYASSPVTTRARFIYGLLCGVLTSVIRIYGGYPEGVSFAILIANVCTPLLEKTVKPRLYGGAK